MGKILKDRTQVTKKGDKIENLSFEIWRQNWEDTKKYGVKAGVNLNIGVEKDIKAYADEEAKADEIIAEWKPLFKGIVESGNTAAVKTVNKFIKDKGLNLKALNAESPDVLQELLDLTKTVVN
jgi:hypothetical protein